MYGQGSQEGEVLQKGRRDHQCPILLNTEQIAIIISELWEFAFGIRKNTSRAMQNLANMQQKLLKNIAKAKIIEEFEAATVNYLERWTLTG